MSQLITLSSPIIPPHHCFRATGITAYLKNGGTLEKAAAMANHVTRMTQLYAAESANNAMKRTTRRKNAKT